MVTEEVEIHIGTGLYLQLTDDEKCNHMTIVFTAKHSTSNNLTKCVRWLIR